MYPLEKESLIKTVNLTGCKNFGAFVGDNTIVF